MQSEGPGLPTVQLPAGVEQLRALQEEVDGLTKQQEELRLAEQLFGMDVTSFPHLIKVWPVCKPGLARLYEATSALGG